MQPVLSESLSVAPLNTRTAQTEAESKTFKSGLTYWTLDLTVKQLSDPICLSSHMAKASQLLRKCMNRGVNVFFQGLNQVCNLHIEDWWLPHDSRWNARPGIFLNFRSGQQLWPSIWRRCRARWLKYSAVYFSELLGTAALRAAPALSCFPIRRALCNLPACYEHEINKTLGHHKSLANDMSGAEIRQPRAARRSTEQGSQPLVLQPAANSLLRGPNV